MGKAVAYFKVTVDILEKARPVAYMIKANY